jgi:hypothetical protein
VLQSEAIPAIATPEALAYAESAAGARAMPNR